MKQNLGILEYKGKETCRGARSGALIPALWEEDFWEFKASGPNRKQSEMEITMKITAYSQRKFRKRQDSHNQISANGRKQAAQKTWYYSLLTLTAIDSSLGGGSQLPITSSIAAGK